MQVRSKWTAYGVMLVVMGASCRDYRLVSDVSSGGGATETTGDTGAGGSSASSISASSASSISASSASSISASSASSISSASDVASPKPYFMVAFDTSWSMSTVVNSSNACGYPNNRLGHGRCAIKNTIQTYGGQANFGLATYARKMVGCSAACFTSCAFSNLPNNAVGNNNLCSLGGCGPEPTTQPNSAGRAGANILVPILSDAVQPPPPTNVPDLLSWVDNDCTNAKELFADGCTPLNGILRDMFRYYADKWVHPSGSPVFNSPLTSVANGERACRSVNVILVTDGDETCDANPADPIDAAGDLLAGFSRDGIAWSVKTFVINFAGGDQTKTNQIAAAGGTGSSLFATDFGQLSSAFASIINSSVALGDCNETALHSASE